MAFTFKQFHVDDHGCGMAVSTDGVLLGAWAALPDSGTVLDIGTGSGLLALMAAQRCGCPITAIELDAEACVQAKANVAASPWPQRIDVQHIDANQHRQQVAAIVCNPPYFGSGERTQKSQGRALARHQDGLTLSQLLECCQRLLTATGFASVILPDNEAQQLIQLLPSKQLHLQRQCLVKTTERKPVQRQLLTFGKQPQPLHSEQLTVHRADGRYSDAFIALTDDFYLQLGSHR
ncbi:tRNA1(Val) (adenine(37)-N6)-methyltransferase [Ferrimonas senticii]|uniref:tRNA1(Val) (adenine(37)-N6)-methyltransferase n=1 Tax=Ferrimonas senticii TaxID=394566 RepID=UPI000412DA60|nr:methyltransferase [Ferrimonas senticii]